MMTCRECALCKVEVQCLDFTEVESANYDAVMMAGVDGVSYLMLASSSVAIAAMWYNLNGGVDS